MSSKFVYKNPERRDSQSTLMTRSPSPLEDDVLGDTPDHIVVTIKELKIGRNDVHQQLAFLPPQRPSSAPPPPIAEISGGSASAGGRRISSRVRNINSSMKSSIKALTKKGGNRSTGECMMSDSSLQFDGLSGIISEDRSDDNISTASSTKLSSKKWTPRLNASFSRGKKSSLSDHIYNHSSHPIRTSLLVEDLALNLQPNSDHDPALTDVINANAGRGEHSFLETQASLTAARNRTSIQVISPNQNYCSDLYNKRLR